MLLLAMDFGGTKHSTATLQYSPDTGMLHWEDSRRVYLPPGADAAYDLAAMASMARELLGRRKAQAIGVSFGGPVEAVSGVVCLSRHVPGWERLPLAARLQEEFGAPARVDNDANAAALGEYRFGAGQGCDSLLYITVSTGVGGGWVLNGKIWRGADSMAGEIGHVIVDPAGPLCPCGKQGCVESLASGLSIAASARSILLSSTRPSLGGDRILKLAGGNPADVTAELISRAAEQADPLAIQILERAAWALGFGIGMAANLLNPQRFILGGGVSKSGPNYWNALRRAARQVALPEIQVEILPAQLGDDAPLWGAAVLAQECLSHG